MKPVLVKPGGSLKEAAVLAGEPAIRFGGPKDAIHLTPKGVEILGTPEFGDYENAMQTAVYLADKAPFWKADLLAYAYRRKDWAGLIDAVIDAGTFTKSTVDQYRSVANRVPPAERVEGVSFSHHEAVASLPSSDRKRLLERSKREHLSVSSLRQLARKERKVKRILKGQASELAKAHDAVSESAWNAREACASIPLHDCQHAEKKIKLARRFLDECEAALAKYRKAQGKSK